jgi:hypothetical protein
MMRFAGCDNLAAAISTSRSRTRPTIHLNADVAGLGGRRERDARWGAALARPGADMKYPACLRRAYNGDCQAGKPRSGRPVLVLG